MVKNGSQMGEEWVKKLLLNNKIMTPNKSYDEISKSVNDKLK